VKSCRTASIFAFAGLGALPAVGACRETPHAEVPPVTTARPDTVLVGETPSAKGDAALDAGPGAPAASLVPDDAGAARVAPVKAVFVDVPGAVAAELCTRTLVAVAKGKVTAQGETLAAGDVLVVTYPDPLKLEGSGLALVVTEALAACAPVPRPPLDKKVVRATSAPKLEWAHGGMSARLDVGAKVSPGVYLGRLEGTSAVAEHTHVGSWEILAAVEAGGSFVLEGTEGRLGPRQIVMVPPGAKHAWTPDPSTRLTAIQLYAPPGPEQRFVTLAAADKSDAGLPPRTERHDAGPLLVPGPPASAPPPPPTPSGPRK